MLRTALPTRHLAARAVAAHPSRRTFVSTVLLSKAWENDTVVELRKEARSRGLSTSGNKSTLVSRIRSNEESKVAEAVRSIETVRHASTDTAVPGKPDIPASAPAIEYLSVKIPDLSIPPAETPVQIPFVPDYWDSASSKSPKPMAQGPTPPRMHVVAGPETHRDGGPMHHLEKQEDAQLKSVDEHPETAPVNASLSTPGGLIRDIADDLGLPRSLGLGQQADQTTDNSERTGKSRPLQREDRTGVWVLLGLIAGSWFVGGVVNAAPKQVAEAEEVKQ